jgi:hypothetical protein
MSEDHAGQVQGAAGQDPPKPFDLIELTASVPGRAAGERGTVVIEGVGRSLVDFAWSDGVTPAASDTARVDNAALRIVERRRRQGSPGKPRTRSRS